MPGPGDSRRALLVAAVAGLLGCASGGVPIERLEPEPLFERAMQAYSAGKWGEAIRAFERLILEYPAHPRLQEARYRLADSYLGRKEYVTAASEFVRLATDYPAGPWADDARFKVCEAYYRLSPKPALDQQYTRAAIEHCQSLATYYPSSEFVGRAEEMLRALREKLAVKVLQNGEFYHRRNALDPAILYYEEVVREYPQSAAAPKALLRLIQIYIRIGYKEEAEAAKERLLREYPNTAEAREAEAITVAGVP